MRRFFNGLINVFSSLGLSCVLLLLLALLTFLGTLEQVDHGLYEVQKKYFESFFLVHDSGAVPIPLPGANLVLCVLAANILLGGMIRLRRGWRTAGVFVTHIGIAMLLLSGFIKMYHSQDGHVTLYEGEQSAEFQSYYRWELAVIEEAGNGELTEHIVPQEKFLHASDGQSVTLSSPELPFELEVANVMRNSRPMPKGPMFEVDVPVVDGIFLKEQDLVSVAEQNIAGAYVTAVTADGERQEGLVWGVERHPFTVRADDKNWGITLRHERYPMPFSVRLDRFTKEEHPRTNMPSVFSSDVTVVEDQTSRGVEISMNEPLRDEGLVLYQASWGPSNARPGDPLFSTLAVVRNPADQYPLWACWVIAIGLLLHFGLKLMRYIQIEAKAS
ncbi:MAG: cytochrome c biogenesis protein ResB [Planctomycetota bacterium]